MEYQTKICFAKNWLEQLEIDYKLGIMNIKTRDIYLYRRLSDCEFDKITTQH